MVSTQSQLASTESDLQELANRHLWMHFTRMSAYAQHEVPVMIAAVLRPLLSEASQRMGLAGS
jgi:hypothetical protein